jgi:hypothetical protein
MAIIAQILKIVIPQVAVIVAYLHIGRTRANKGVHYQSMNPSAIPNAIAAQYYEIIRIECALEIPLWPIRNNPRPGLSIPSFVKAPNSTVITNLIAREFRNWFPYFFHRVTPIEPNI